MEDLISRQALCEYALNQKDKSITPNDIMRFPSAQPETHEERTETHACDLISRQAAIDAILAVTGNSSVRELYEHVQEHGLSDMWSGGVNAAIDIIIAVPSAQPDMSEYSDKLWKAAYERGKAEALAQLEEAYISGETEAETRFHAEIVRCKDCKLHGTNGYRLNCAVFCCTMPDDGFCSCGERREE